MDTSSVESPQTRNARDVSRHLNTLTLHDCHTLNQKSTARDRSSQDKKTTSAKSKSDETLDGTQCSFHLPVLSIRRPPDGPFTSKPMQYKRSTSADQESPKNDHFLLAPIVTSLRRGYSSEDISKSASDSALHASISSSSSHPLDSFRQRSSSTSLTQSKNYQLVAPKISIDEYPEKGKFKREPLSSSYPRSGSTAYNSGNLTPPVDRSKRFPRSIRNVSTSCECQGLHAKTCLARVLSRSMENINGNSTRTELSADPRLSRLKQNLFPSYPFSAPASPKNVHKSFGSPNRQKSVTLPVTVVKSQLLPRARSQSARNLRQIQISPSPPRRKLNARQPLPKLKLSDAEDDTTSPTNNENNDEKLWHPSDRNLLAPGRLEIRSPPLTDYSSDW